MKVWIGAVLLAALVASGCGKGARGPEGGDPAGDDGREPLGPPGAHGHAGGGGSGLGAHPEDDGSLLPRPGPGQAIHPLTGQAVAAADLNRRHILVSVDNLDRARPQSGLSQADLIYEAPMEGGITRLLALYRAGSAPAIGPVRSSRHYVLDVAMEWDAVLVHVGGSPQHYEQVGSTGLHVIDDMKGAAGGGVFHRVQGRKAPHNLYTGSAELRNKLADRGWDRPAPPRQPFRFVEPEDLPPSEPGREVVIPWPGHAKEMVTYRYDPESHVYVRYLGPHAHRDALDDEPLRAGSVLIQFVPVRPIPGDAHGRLDVGLVGEGRLLVATGGGVREGRWSKEGRDGPTRWLEEDGTTPVSLLPGQVWVLLVPETVTVEVQ